MRRCTDYKYVDKKWALEREANRKEGRVLSEEETKDITVPAPQLSFVQQARKFTKLRQWLMDVYKGGTEEEFRRFLRMRFGLNTKQKQNPTVAYIASQVDKDRKIRKAIKKKRVHTWQNEKRYHKF